MTNQTRLAPTQVAGTSMGLFTNIDEEVKNLFNNTKHIKPPVATEAELPTAGEEDGEQRAILGLNKIVRWDKFLTKWVDLAAPPTTTEPTPVPTTGSSGALATAGQITKLGVTATQVAPLKVVIPISETPDLNLPAVEVLKFIPGVQQTQTVCIFDNTDAANFESNSYITFDGTMQIKTNYDSAMTESLLGTGKVFEGVIDKSAQLIEKIEVI